MISLTVVVPVYNARKYLSRCLDSLLSQCVGFVGKYEILCIDDGSTDGSARILDEYRRLYPDIFRVITQSNRGVAKTRNRGIDEAQGEIVTFCDQDDYLVPNAYRYLLDSFWSADIDVLTFQSVTLDSYKIKTWRENNDPSGIVLYEGKGREVYPQRFFEGVWNHFYRKSFLNQHSLRLPDVQITEDNQFNLDVYMANARVRACSSNVYRYTVNDQQVTTTRQKRRMRQLLPCYVLEYERFNRYISSCSHEELSLKEALMHKRYDRMQPFLSRVLSADLTSVDYLGLRDRLVQIGYFDSLPRGRVGIIVRFVYSSFFLYKMASIMFRTIFIPYVLPRISRN